MTDLRKIYLIAFLRAVATGMIGVLLAIYLYEIHFDSTQTGVVISVGLGSAALMTAVATFFSSYFNQRRFLSLIALMSSIGGLWMAWTHQYSWILCAAALGMVNGMGKDRGASLVIETALLPAMTTDQDRTKVFAWYSVAQDAGHAMGALLAGLPTLLSYFFQAYFFQTYYKPGILSYQLSVSFYALLMGAVAILYQSLSISVEKKNKFKIKISEESKKILFKISALFAMDSVAGGFLTSALLAFYFFERFGVPASTIGILFFCTRVLNAFSHLGAAFLARHIGLVNTMVFTHIPAGLLLMTVIVAPNFQVAVVLFLLRESLVEMDVPTRQSYVMAVTKPHERIFVSGVTHLVRMAGWAFAPVFAGFFMQKMSLALPLLIGALLKISYDVLLYFSFKGMKAPEEIV